LGHRRSDLIYLLPSGSSVSLTRARVVVVDQRNSKQLTFDRGSDS
jgi:hypothetical protein